ncbi:XRCC1 protein, partial [Crotophaga sulcirostris]|nr:XRCC1 protein [Crotophaga sulcirostris]
MAPIKISYVVSFSSQDPKFPVENLLREDNVQPWLGCPQDRSRQLRAELQLERASPIGYVDVGNCGCAFLQLEVGRSSWPCDRPYLTLLPSVALMTPADSKLERNRCGVRMFKEADFLALALGQQWDRVRLTCSQPFSRHSRFGLSFLRLRAPTRPEPPEPPLPDPQQPPTPSQPGQVEEQVRSHLQQLEPNAQSPARLSRPAQMVLLAARSRALRPRAATGIPRGDPELLAEQPGHPRVPGEPEPPARGTSWCREPLCRCFSSTKAPRVEPHTPHGAGAPQQPLLLLPTGRFPLDLLPTHASRCGEEDLDAAWPSSSLSGTSPDAWVSCPICQLPFDITEVEQHASTCGDPAGTPGT